MKVSFWIFLLVMIGTQAHAGCFSAVDDYLRSDAAQSAIERKLYEFKDKTNRRLMDEGFDGALYDFEDIPLKLITLDFGTFFGPPNTYEKKLDVEAYAGKYTFRAKDDSITLAYYYKKKTQSCELSISIRGGHIDLHTRRVWLPEVIHRVSIKQ